MAEHSTIEWTDATWNPITGCSVVSPGCTNCYAMKLAGTRLKHIPSRQGLTRDSKAGPVWTGEVRLNRGWLDQPLRWKRPHRIFVCAHGDLFAENVPDEWIDQVFAVMALAPQHTFQVLTKRPARMRDYLGRPGDQRASRHHAIMKYVRALARPGIDVTSLRPVGADRHNVWLGFSAEDQARYDARRDAMLDISWAGPKFVSAEPLLGPINFGFGQDHCDLCGGTGILARWPKGTCHVCGGRGRVTICGPSRHDGYRMLQWVIVGGESGPGARPMHPDWARSIRDQCAAAGVPFFFKQWGAWQIAEEIEQAQGIPRHWRFPAGDEFHIISDGHDIIMCEAQDSRTPKKIWRDYWADGHGNLAKRCGKKGAGRLLDGVEHNAMPEVREVPA